MKMWCFKNNSLENFDNASRFGLRLTENWSFSNIEGLKACEIRPWVVFYSILDLCWLILERYKIYLMFSKFNLIWYIFLISVFGLLLVNITRVYKLTNMALFVALIHPISSVSMAGSVYTTVAISIERWRGKQKKDVL